MCTTYLSTSKRRLQAFRFNDAVRRKHFEPCRASQKLRSTKYRQSDAARHHHQRRARSSAHCSVPNFSDAPAQTLCFQGFASPVGEEIRRTSHRFARCQRRFQLASKGVAVARVGPSASARGAPQNRLQKISEKNLRKDPLRTPNSFVRAIGESPPFRPRHRQHSATLRRTLALSERGGDD